MANTETNSFPAMLTTIKDMMAKTLDPSLWKGNEPGSAQRNMPMVGLLTMMEAAEIKTANGQKKMPEGSYGIKIEPNGEVKIGDLAAYLAMGGRVIFEYGKGVDPKEVMPVLFGCDTPEQMLKVAKPRLTSTHGLEHKDGKSKEIRSTKLGVGKAIVNALRLGGLQGHKEVGVNLAIGGVGNKDVNNDPITADGRHGHMLMYEKKPSKGHNGALMVGVENVEFGKKAPNGQEHGLAGKSGKLSPFQAFKMRYFKNEDGNFPGTKLPMPALDNNHKEPLGEMVVTITPELLAKAKEMIDKYKQIAGDGKEVIASVRSDVSLPSSSSTSLSSQTSLSPSPSATSLGSQTSLSPSETSLDLKTSQSAKAIRAELQKAIHEFENGLGGRFSPEQLEQLAGPNAADKRVGEEVNTEPPEKRRKVEEEPEPIARDANLAPAVTQTLDTGKRKRGEDPDQATQSAAKKAGQEGLKVPNTKLVADSMQRSLENAQKGFGVVAAPQGGSPAAAKGPIR